MANGSSGSSNAALILVLGILSIVICAPLGIAAWIMGNNALAEIAEVKGIHLNEVSSLPVESVEL